MILRLAVVVLICICAPCKVPAQAGNSPRTEAAPARVLDNPELEKIFISDQVDRGNNSFSKPGAPPPPTLTGLEIRHNDDAREARIRQLLDAASLHTATDYYHAALVFQHSASPSGYLLAHVLADIAVSKGNPDALWLSAATLDRYLQSIKQPQVFGTQYKSIPDPDKKGVYTYDQIDFDSTLVTDTMRADLCVKPLAKQRDGLPGPPAGTGLFPCAAARKLESRRKP
jgi:hypothetical protein